jgi:hypothetical protein
MAAKDTHAIIQELLEAKFSVWSVPTLYNGVHLPLEESLETAERRVGGWCQLAASRELVDWSELLGERVSERERGLLRFSRYELLL